jgi:hypothetical protein
VESQQLSSASTPGGPGRTGAEINIDHDEQAQALDHSVGAQQQRRRLGV